MSEEERGKKWQRDYRIRTLLLIIAFNKKNPGKIDEESKNP